MNRIAAACGLIHVMAASLWRRLNAGRDHRWARSRISDYVDGQLPEGEQHRLAAHEEICPDCNRVVRTLRTMIAALGSLGRSARPPSVADRATREVMRAIEEGRGETGQT